jgi:AraC-like DNA-binding protein
MEGEDSKISYEQLALLYEEAARSSGDDAFGLHVGERTSPTMYGMLGYGVANSRTFGEALDHLLQFQRLWSEAVGFELVQAANTLRLRYWHRGRLNAEARRQETEQMMAAMLSFAAGAVGSTLSAVEVRFEHQAPPDVTEHKRIFGCSIFFGAPFTEIVFPARLLEMPLTGADPALGRLINQQAEAALAAHGTREPFLDQVRGLVRECIRASGQVSLPTLAKAAGLQPRTLQRKLRQRGLTFREIVEEARMELAKLFLEDPGAAIGRIAFDLGYSQPSAFHRAFLRRLGATPRQYRKQWEAQERH